jgi:hypothetical protein
MQKTIILAWCNWQHDTLLMCFSRFESWRWSMNYRAQKIVLDTYLDQLYDAPSKEMWWSTINPEFRQLPSDMLLNGDYHVLLQHIKGRINQSS